MTTHELKIWPEHFRAVLSGRKAFELRKDDRGYEEGNLLVLREWEPATQDYTGRQVERKVVHVLRQGYGLRTGFVGLGLSASLPDFTPRMMDLQAQLDQALQGRFIERLAEILGVKVSWGFEPGFEIETLLKAAEELRRLAGPDAQIRFTKALDLTREAHQLMLMGHAPRAKEAMGEASVELLRLQEGRVE
jgi:hypothetical protein